MDRSDHLLIAANPADVATFAGSGRPSAGAHGTVVVWERAAETGTEALAPAHVAAASDYGDFASLRARSLDEAGEVTARLVESGWWDVGGMDVARLLRDFIIREIANHLFAVLRIEAILEECCPGEVHVPLPLKPGYYMADGMVFESARLVANSRGIGFRSLGGQWRRARSAALELKRRMGNELRQDREIRQALLSPLAAAPIGLSPPPVRSRGTICVGPCWGAELQSLQPISDALRERGWHLVCFEIPSYYSRPDWQADVLPEGAVPVGYWGGRRAFVQAARLSEELCHRLRDRTAQQQAKDAFKTLGVDLLDSSYLHARLMRLAQVDARLAVAMHMCGSFMCESLNPDLLFSVKAEGPEVRGIMGAAQDLGVPVAFMPHGLNADDPRWADIHADLVLAYGDEFAECIARRSHGKIAVKAIGTPKYDAFFGEQASHDTACARRGFGMADHALWIGVATTDRSAYDRENVKAAAAFARRHGDAAVLVKTHPRLSQEELVRGFREAAGPGGVVLSKVDTMRALWCCDVVVTGVSSAAIEALAAGRPVIYVGDPEDDLHGYVQAGVCLSVSSPEALGEAISELLGDVAGRESLVAKGREFARRKLGPLDGRATARAVEEIERLAGRG